MPRNNTGVYSLPNAPFVPGTVISSAAVNSDLADIAAALTGSVASNGVTVITGQLKSSVNTSPAYSSNADTTTGFGSSTPGEADVWVSGTIVGAFTSTGLALANNLSVAGNLTVTGSVTAGSFNFSGTGAIGIPVGTTAQRPASPVQGQIRYNSTNANYEGYDGTEWDPMSQINRSYAITASISGGLLTVNILNARTGAVPTAADPVAFDIIATGGLLATVVANSALTINTNGVGATLGSSNGVPFRFWLVVFNNVGTPVLGLVNCSNATQVFSLTENVGRPGTAISSAATSAGVIYTPNGTAFGPTAFKILGFVEYASGLATAGTYGTGPTFLCPFTVGTKRPGDIVQKVTAFVTAGTTCGTGFTQTNVTGVIAPSSAINPVEIRSYVACTCGPGSLNQVQLSRGNGPTLIGSTPNLAGQATVAINLVVPIYAFDLPETIGAVTYTVFGKAGSASQLVVSGGAGGSVIEMTELMG